MRYNQDCDELKQSLLAYRFPPMEWSEEHMSDFVDKPLGEEEMKQILGTKEYALRKSGKRRMEKQ
eukprot:gene12578-5806_t